MRREALGEDVAVWRQYFSEWAAMFQPEMTHRGREGGSWAHLGRYRGERISPPCQALLRPFVRRVAAGSAAGCSGLQTFDLVSALPSPERNKLTRPTEQSARRRRRCLPYVLAWSCGVLMSSSPPTRRPGGEQLPEPQSQIARDGGAPRFCFLLKAAPPLLHWAAGPGAYASVPRQPRRARGVPQPRPLVP